jgi:O-antigen ligase
MSERLVFGYGTSAGDGPAARGPRTQPADTAVPAPGRPERRDWAFLGLFVFTALLYFRPQDTIRPLIALHLPELAAIFALSALFFGRLQRGQTLTRMTPELGAVFALGLVILATAPFSIWMGGAVRTFLDLYAKVVLIFILLVNTLTTPKKVERLTWLIVIASGYIAVGSVVDYVRGINLVEYGRGTGAVGGMFKNPNDLALNMVAALPLCLAFVLRRVPAWKRLIALACAVAMLGAIVASQSRSGTVGLAVMIAVLAWQLLRRRPGLVAAGALAAALAAPLLPQAYWNRMASIADGSRDDTGSREARSTLFVEAWHAFLADPLTGVGAGQFVNYDPDGREQAWRETHNVILQVAAELGLFGLLIFLFLLFRAARAPLQMRRFLQAAARPPNGGAPLLTESERSMLDVHSVVMLASIAGWFACAFFASVAYHWTFYYVLGLTVAPRELLRDRLAADRAPGRRRARVAPVAVGARA